MRRSPSQKRFETQLLDALQRLDRTRTIFVESESRRIGALQVPQALLDTHARRALRAGGASTPLRIALLRDEYAHFLDDTAELAQALAPLATLHGHKVIERWNAAAARGDWDTLVGELLTMHTIRCTRARSTATFRATSMRWWCSGRHHGRDLPRDCARGDRRGRARNACRHAGLEN
jgi:hypothetical protein